MNTDDIKQRAKDLGVPVIPRLPPQSTPTWKPNPVVAICGECGRDVHNAEGYYCNRGNCPLQVNFTMVTTS